MNILLCSVIETADSVDMVKVVTPWSVKTNYVCVLQQCRICTGLYFTLLNNVTSATATTVT